MNELCVPVPGITENDVAEVIVSIKGKKVKHEFRIESFPWETDETITKSQYWIKNIRAKYWDLVMVD